VTTIGVDFRFKFLNIDDKVVKVQLWDTAGQERYRSLCNIYYKGADFIIMVFDLTDIVDSSENLRESGQRLDQRDLYLLLR